MIDLLTSHVLQLKMGNQSSIGGQAQQTLQKDKLAAMLYQDQQRVNSTCGRIIAELEDLIKQEDPSYNSKFDDYLVARGQGPTSRMMNIENYIIGLEVMLTPRKEAQHLLTKTVKNPEMPQIDPQDIQRLRHYVKALQNPVSLNLGLHVLSGLENGYLAEIPVKLSEAIMSSEKHYALRVDAIKNDQKMILGMMHNSHKVAEEATKHYGDGPKSHKPANDTGYLPHNTSFKTPKMKQYSQHESAQNFN